MTNIVSSLDEAHTPDQIPGRHGQSQSVSRPILSPQWRWSGNTSSRRRRWRRCHYADVRKLSSLSSENRASFLLLGRPQQRAPLIRISPFCQCRSFRIIFQPLFPRFGGARDVRLLCHGGAQRFSGSTQKCGPWAAFTPLNVLVGAEGFEPPALCSQSRCATRLRYAPTLLLIVT